MPIYIVTILYNDGKIDKYEDVEEIKVLEQAGFLKITFNNNEVKLISLQNVREINKTNDYSKLSTDFKEWFGLFRYTNER